MTENTILDEYLKIVASVKSYVEDQLDLGYIDTPTENGKDNLDIQQSNLLITADKTSFATMDDILKAVRQCRACSLCDTRTNVVFGTGNENAKLVFVGEAPGADEDQQGKPFVGKAGQKLTQIINAIGLSRDEVYITNVLKCRPPNNRNPLPHEIEACEPYLIAQLGLIKPKVICALGTFATQTLLRTDQQISKLRGRFHTYQGIRLMPTYHPAYLLRNPTHKRDVWEDVQKVRIEYDRE
jgi:uracil-DNA glycosylase family 4